MFTRGPLDEQSHMFTRGPLDDGPMMERLGSDSPEKHRRALGSCFEARIRPIELGNQKISG